MVARWAIDRWTALCAREIVLAAADNRIVGLRNKDAWELRLAWLNPFGDGNRTRPFHRRIRCTEE